MGVVPVRARILGDEPVDVPAADRDSVLGDAGDAVLGVRQVDAVPVQGGPVGHRVVEQGHLQQVALVGAQQRPGGGVVDRVARNSAAADQRDRLLAGHQRDRDVRTPDGPGQLGHRRRCSRARGVLAEDMSLMAGAAGPTPPVGIAISITE